jgi:large subunit ribosomal protein L37Ae
MAKKASLSSAKRFGVRYGKRNKEKIAILEKEHRGRRKCPFCNYIKVRRLSKGIWNCEKCNAKFAGKAYTFVTPKKTAEIVKTEVEEEPEEEMLEEELQEEEPTEEKVEEVVEEIEEPSEKTEVA